MSAPVESVFVEIHIGLGAEMNHRRTDDSESRFAGYVEGLASVIGHKDREEPLRHYCTGLLMPCQRKSVEPMAVREIVLPRVERHGAIEAWIIDDTGFAADRI